MNKMHKIAEAVFGEELEVIESFIIKEPTLSENTNKKIWYLGRSVQMMAEADYYIGFETWLSIIEDNKGCQIESQIADDYNIRKCLITDPDMANEILSDMVKPEPKEFSPMEEKEYTLAGNSIHTTNPYEKDMTVSYVQETIQTLNKNGEVKE